MTETKTCPKCGTPLPSDAPSGICPKCLMRAGMGSEDESCAGGSEVAFEGTRQCGDYAPPEPAALALRFPDLEIVESLGHGGMGAVYKARQKKLNRLVALKIIKPELADDPSFTERFHREARTLARLNHPNIVAVHDFGEADQLHYIIMEYVDGVTLRHLLEAQQLKPEQALAVVSQVCAGLQFAHDEGIVHRDIKPENILIDSKGQVKIADFGLAKLAAHSPEALTITGTHQVMGTPTYMAPEQRESSREVDHRADIYSLGVVFYEMLTGEVPLGHFEPPSQKVPVDDRLDGIVLRSLAAEPDRRFQQAVEMKSSVEEVSAHPRSWRDVGISTIVERELQDAWNWIVGDFRKAPQHHLKAPFLLIVVLSFAGGAMVFLPWMHLEIDKLSSIGDVAVEPEKPVSQTFAGYELWLGIAAAAAFVGSALLAIAGPINKPLAVWRAATMTVIASVALLSTLLFQRELESQTYRVSFVDLEDGSNDIKYYPAFLHGLDHRVTYRTGFWGSLGLSAGLLLLGVTGIRHAVGHRAETRSESTRTSDPPLTSLRFRVAAHPDIAAQIAFHFSALGYRLVRERPNEWVFRRGSSWGGLWNCDIHGLRTTLTVRSSPGKEGELHIGCTWAVRTLGAWIPRRDIKSLEAEGHELESLLGGEDPRGLDDSEPITPQFSVVAIIGAAMSHLLIAAAVLSSVVLWRNRIWFVPPVDWTPILLHAFGIVLIGGVTTLLGIVSIIRIRDSQGRLKGLVLAFIAALPFPLLLLNAAIYGLLYFITGVFFTDTQIFMAMTPMLWVSADILYVYLAWRMVSHTAG